MNTNEEVKTTESTKEKQINAFVDNIGKTTTKEASDFYVHYMVKQNEKYNARAEKAINKEQAFFNGETEITIKVNDEKQKFNFSELTETAKSKSAINYIGFMPNTSGTFEFTQALKLGKKRNMIKSDMIKTIKG
jgi:hypothetical protein